MFIEFCIEQRTHPIVTTQPPARSPRPGRKNIQSSEPGAGNTLLSSPPMPSFKAGKKHNTVAAKIANALSASAGIEQNNICFVKTLMLRNAELSLQKLQLTTRESGLSLPLNPQGSESFNEGDAQKPALYRASSLSPRAQAHPIISSQQSNKLEST